jgi:hypothetical protein
MWHRDGPCGEDKKRKIGPCSPFNDQLVLTIDRYELLKMFPTSYELGILEKKNQTRNQLTLVV